LKASFVAFAFLVSIAPAVADEASSSRPGVRVGETQVSRIYRVRWAAAFKRSQDHSTRLTAARSAGGAKLAVSREDETRNDAKWLAAKVRKIMALAEAELLSASDRPYVIKRRMHVSCKTKYIVAARNEPVGGGPGIRQAALGDADPVVLETKKLCTVRYRLSRIPVGDVNAKQDFVISLPDLQLAADQPKSK
jgi:hypothetical protein